MNDKYEILEKYLKTPHKCPFCNSENLQGREIDIESGQAFQTVECLDCNKEWMDKYQLVGMLEVHDFEQGEDILEDGNIDMKGILLKILDNPAVLPLLKGIDPELDDLLERKLKK